MDGTVIDKNFTYHPPSLVQQDNYQILRHAGRDFAHMLNEMCPDSREKSLALTNLEQAVMWANAAIARNEPTDPRRI